MLITVNGQQFDIRDLPFDIEGTNIRLEGQGKWEEIMQNPRDKNSVTIIAPGLGTFKTTMFAKQTGRTSYMYMETHSELDSDDLVPPEDANTWCTKGANAEALDKDGDWSTSVFSVWAHHNVCEYCTGWNQNNQIYTEWLANGVSRTPEQIQRDSQCLAPPPLPPHPEAREECQNNGCSFSHGEQMCGSLKSNDILFGDCVNDFCVTCEDSIAVDEVEDAEEDDPSPICAQGSASCSPDDVCSSAVKMNTLKVSQNNLGGAGPDSGAEEIRYSKAAVINGQTVDLVIKADGLYTPFKTSRNGNNEGGFGILNLKCGSSTTMLFSVVDSDTGAPVTLDSVAITWYDIDEGKKSKGRESVTVCGTSGAIVSDTNTLTMSATGDCHTATSSVAGTGKDNPSSPYTLTPEHLARASTFPLVGVSKFSSTLSLAKGFKGRNFMFAFEPTVACA